MYNGENWYMKRIKRIKCFIKNDKKVESIAKKVITILVAMLAVGNLIAGDTEVVLKSGSLAFLNNSGEYAYLEIESQYHHLHPN